MSPDWSILDFQLQVTDGIKRRKHSAVKQPEALMKCGTLISELWNYRIPVDLHVEFKDHKEDEIVSSEKSLFTSHIACGWGLSHVIISGSKLLPEKWNNEPLLLNHCLHLSKDVQEMSALLLYETGQRADTDRQTDKQTGRQIARYSEPKSDLTESPGRKYQ